MVKLLFLVFIFYPSYGFGFYECLAALETRQKLELTGNPEIDEFRLAFNNNAFGQRDASWIEYRDHDKDEVFGQVLFSENNVVFVRTRDNRIIKISGDDLKNIKSSTLSKISFKLFAPFLKRGSHVQVGPVSTKFRDKMFSYIDAQLNLDQKIERLLVEGTEESIEQDRTVIIDSIYSDSVQLSLIQGNKKIGMKISAEDLKDFSKTLAFKFAFDRRKLYGDYRYVTLPYNGSEKKAYILDQKPNGVLIVDMLYDEENLKFKRLALGDHKKLNQVKLSPRAKEIFLSRFNFYTFRSNIKDSITVEPETLLNKDKVPEDISYRLKLDFKFV